MKVGLVRHFRVKKDLPLGKLVTPHEVNQWLDEYDLADVDIGKVDLGGIDWRRCYASDLPRALTTAAACHPGPIVPTPQLREVPLRASVERHLRLPFILWGLLTRLAYARAHPSLVESPAQVQARIRGVLEAIIEESAEDVLIVSHGLVMTALRDELRRRGFRGPRFTIPQNGRLYIFEA